MDLSNIFPLPAYGFIKRRVDSSTIISAFDWDQLAKIRRQHDRKGSLKISKVAKFESDFLQTNEDIAPQSQEILQIRYRCLYCGWQVRVPHNTKKKKTSVKFRDF